MIRKIQWFAMAVTAVLCAACDAHIDVPDTAVRPGPNTVKVRKGTAMRFTCGTLLRQLLPTASVSHKGRRPTSRLWTGT